MHRGGWGLETRLQNADTCVSKESKYRGLDGEATECRLCKHCGCMLNTDYIWLRKSSSSEKIDPTQTRNRKLTLCGLMRKPGSLLNEFFSTSFNRVFPPLSPNISVMVNTRSVWLMSRCVPLYNRWSPISYWNKWSRQNLSSWSQHTGLLHTSLISIFLWHQDHLPECWKILSKSYTFKTQGRCWL